MKQNGIITKIYTKIRVKIPKKKIDIYGKNGAVITSESTIAGDPIGSRRITTQVRDLCLN